jgi:ribose transport system substrate-binding protein
MGTLVLGMTCPDTRLIFWALVELGVRNKAAELGVEIRVITTDEVDEQTAAIRQFAADRVDAMLYSPADSTAVHDLTMLIPGLPVVCVEGEGAPGVTCRIQADLQAGAFRASTYLMEHIGGQGIVAQIPGPNSPRRTAGFYDAAAHYPNIKPVEHGDGAWTRTGGQQVMQAILAEHPQVRAVFAHSDEMAIGATLAIQAAGHSGNIHVAGVDAMPDALLAIVANRMLVSASSEPYQIGQQAVETAIQLAQGHSMASTITTEMQLVTAENVVPTALSQLGFMPGLLSELSDSSRRQRKLQANIIESQQGLIQELSSPIIPISDNILVLPLVGRIDALRAVQIIESVLSAITQSGTQVLIIDITGVAIVDTHVAHHLLQLAQAVKLLGAQTILVGVTPEVAQTIVHLNIDLSALITRATLQSGLSYAEARLLRTTNMAGIH